MALIMLCNFKINKHAQRKLIPLFISSFLDSLDRVIHRLIISNENAYSGRVLVELRGNHLIGLSTN